MTFQSKNYKKAHNSLSLSLAFSDGRIASSAAQTSQIIGSRRISLVGRGYGIHSTRQKHGIDQLEAAVR